MADVSQGLDPAILNDLRLMAGVGKPPSALFNYLKGILGQEFHIGTMLLYFREAFHLPLSAVKPIAAFTRNEEREISDLSEFDEALGNAIQENRNEWSLI
jgi:hypothetical protein